MAIRRNRNDGQEQYIDMEEHKLKIVSQFIYLESIITEDNDIKTNVSSKYNKLIKDIMD